MELFNINEQDKAYSEGWYIADCEGSENGPFQLQMLEESDLVTDEDAWTLVYKKAHKGSNYHQQVLMFLDDNNPLEYQTIIKYCRANAGAKK